MSHDEILREITNEQELAAAQGGDGWDVARRAWWEATQFMQCSGLKDCGGCDPNGPYRSGSGTSSDSGGSFHC